MNGGDNNVNILDMFGNFIFINKVDKVFKLKFRFLEFFRIVKEVDDMIGKVK